MQLAASLPTPPVRLVVTLLALPPFAIAAVRAPWRTWLGGSDRPAPLARQPRAAVAALVTAGRGDARTHGAVSAGQRAGADALQHHDLMDWPANLLWSGLVPIGATVPVHRVVAARLPHNYFVYFFVTLLAGSVLALVLAARTPLGLLWASDAIPLPQVGDENLLLLPMMALAEAFMNVRGPAVALVYSPQWVARCDARLDLRRR